MPIKIITDSGSDLLLDVVKLINVDIVPLPVQFEDDLMPKDISTANAGPQVFLNKYKEVKPGTTQLTIFNR
ncbi:DegV family protein [Paenibacillus albidus]|uniref:DegV family protein n=1 Tax=Paenibacillus albidus TaxID=2041023 RepID=UPI001BE86850|nr:DegV family protein [Paenibacillus albidus]MBT2293153.1 DegV family protein [Paenibacillus albidus]